MYSILSCLQCILILGNIYIIFSKKTFFATCFFKCVKFITWRRHSPIWSFNDTNVPLSRSEQTGQRGDVMPLNSTHPCAPEEQKSFSWPPSDVWQASVEKFWSRWPILAFMRSVRLHWIFRYVCRTEIAAMTEHV